MKLQENCNFPCRPLWINYRHILLLYKIVTRLWTPRAKPLSALCQEPASEIWNKICKASTCAEFCSQVLQELGMLLSWPRAKDLLRATQGTGCAQRDCRLFTLQTADPLMLHEKLLLKGLVSEKHKSSVSWGARNLLLCSALSDHCLGRWMEK